MTTQPTFSSVRDQIDALSELLDETMPSAAMRYGAMIGLAKTILCYVPDDRMDAVADDLAAMLRQNAKQEAA